MHTIPNTRTCCSTRLFFLARPLALLELDDLSLLADALALVRLRWPLSPNAVAEVTQDDLVGPVHDQQGVLLFHLEGTQQGSRRPVRICQVIRPRLPP